MVFTVINWINDSRPENNSSLFSIIHKKVLLFLPHWNYSNSNQLLPMPTNLSQWQKVCFFYIYLFLLNDVSESLKHTDLVTARPVRSGKRLNTTRSTRGRLTDFQKQHIMLKEFKSRSQPSYCAPILVCDCKWVFNVTVEEVDSLLRIKPHQMIFKP